MYEFFKFVFYGLGLIAVCYEIWTVSAYKELEAIRLRVKKVESKELSLKDDENTGLCLFIIFQFLYMGWTLIGFFSSQWVAFLLLALLSVLNGVLKLHRSEEGNLIDSILSIFLILFAIINTYHLHIKFF